MALHPQCKAFLDQLASMGGRPMHEMTPAEARGLSLPPELAGPERPMHSVVNRTVPGPAGQIPVRIYTATADGKLPGLIYFHGGGFILGTLDSSDRPCRDLAHLSGRVVVSVDYRLAPEHPFPAALDDAACAYRWLLAQGADPRRIAVMGDSAGGGLTFGTLLKLRDEGEPMPAAAAGLSPWTDLTITSASSRLFAKTDPMLNLGDTKHYVAWYLGDADRRNPYASPVFGDPAGLPPSLIQAGDDEMLRDDAVTMAERLRAAGVPAELELWPRMPHVWHMLARVVPEGQQAIERIGLFVQQQWAASTP